MLIRYKQKKAAVVAAEKAAVNRAGSLSAAETDSRGLATSEALGTGGASGHAAEQLEGGFMKLLERVVKSLSEVRVCCALLAMLFIQQYIVYLMTCWHFAARAGVCMTRVMTDRLHRCCSC